MFSDIHLDDDFLGATKKKKKKKAFDMNEIGAALPVHFCYWVIGIDRMY